MCINKILLSDLVSDSWVEDLTDIFPISEEEDVVRYLIPTLQLCKSSTPLTVVTICSKGTPFSSICIDSLNAAS